MIKKITSIFTLCSVLMVTNAHAGCVSSDCKHVAQAIYFEARGEGKRGMHAVANVIMNRAKKRKLSPKAVVRQPYQFSYRSRKDLVMREPKAKARANKIALAAVTGKLKDITGGATYFRTVGSGSWGKSIKKTVRIGNHNFYK